jgi:hypothetical protein
MQNKLRRAATKVLAFTAVTLIALLVLASRAAAASGYKVIYTFKGKTKKGDFGRNPLGNLALTTNPELYGTTVGGGPTFGQVAYRLTPTSQGQWQETVLFSFDEDGYFCYALCNPNGDLISDQLGNYYGTTGSWRAPAGNYHNAGGVYELASSGGQQVLYVFQGLDDKGNCTSGPDGCNPQGGLIYASSGNIYGTTKYGGTSRHCKKGCGTVFELFPTRVGWAENILYSFTDGGDGEYPTGALVSDAAGNLYGTAGTVFKLTPLEDGSGSFVPIYQNIGAHGSLIFDQAGNLYGTSSPGAYGYGDVFELSLNSGGTWTETVLYSFTGGADGRYPWGSLTFDANGNLYGTTEGGGAYGNGTGDGTVFELTPASGGGWTESVLHSFSSQQGGGFTPEGGVVLDSSGNIYGTTRFGAIKGGPGPGLAFEITP